MKKLKARKDQLGNIHSTGVPSKLQSGLITRGNVTKGHVTGVQSIMKQSFSDLNDAALYTDAQQESHVLTFEKNSNLSAI
jgi:hypothetical protein